MGQDDLENAANHDHTSTTKKKTPFKNSLCFMWFSQKTTFWAVLIFTTMFMFGLVAIILGGIVDGMIDREEMTLSVPCIVNEHNVNCTNECINNGLNVVPQNFTLAGCRTFCRSSVVITLDKTNFNTTVSNLRQVRSTEPYVTSSLFYTSLSVNSTTSCFVNLETIDDTSAKTSFAYVYGPKLVMKTISIVFGCVAIGCLIYMAIYVAYETQNCWRYYQERKHHQPHVDK